MRGLAAELVHRLIVTAGWLSAPVTGQALRRWQRRWGLAMRRWHLVLAGVVSLRLLQLSLRLARRVRRLGDVRALKERMRKAAGYDQWREAAEALDALEGRDRGQIDALFDQQQLRRRVAALRELREQGATFELMFSLRVDHVRSAGALANKLLANSRLACPRVPPSVQEYIDEVKLSLEHVATSSELEISDKLSFLRELRHAFGRSGLVLSGGGSFGFFHFGVCRALGDAGLLPRVVSGSSAGSIGGAMLCTRTDEELEVMHETFADMEGLDFYSNAATRNILSHFMQKGTAHDYRFFHTRLQRLYGDLTFAEAYQRTGRILNIAVCAADTREPPRVLNYLTAPHVLIWSAVACSSAFPLLFEAQDLMAKDSDGQLVKFSQQGPSDARRRWRDGSLEEDLPMRSLSEQFGVNLFITSQCNPYLQPVMWAKSFFPEALWRLVETEGKHWCRLLMAFFPHNLTLKMVVQPWEGDITMYLPPDIFPLARAAHNFSPDDIRVLMRAGLVATWRKLPAIQAACGVEVAIDDTLKAVTRLAQTQRRLERAALHRRAMVAAAAGAGGMRGRLPSWLHLPSLGLGIPISDSQDSIVAGLTPLHGSTGSMPELPVVQLPASGFASPPRRRRGSGAAAAESAHLMHHVANRLAPIRTGATAGSTGSAAQSCEGSAHGSITASDALASMVLGVTGTVAEEAAAEEQAAAEQRDEDRAAAAAAAASGTGSEEGSEGKAPGPAVASSQHDAVADHPSTPEEREKEEANSASLRSISFIDWQRGRQDHRQAPGWRQLAPSVRSSQSEEALDEPAAAGIEATASALEDLEHELERAPRLEGGPAAWRDVAELAFGLDVIAP